MTRQPQRWMQDGEAIDGARLPLKVKWQTQREEATLTIFWHASRKLWRVVAVSGRALSFRLQHEYCASMAMCNRASCASTSCISLGVRFAARLLRRTKHNACVGRLTSVSHDRGLVLISDGALCTFCAVLVC